MLLGRIFHTADAKNRIFIPAKFREELGKTFVITKNLRAACLELYPMSVWAEREKLIENASVELRDLIHENTGEFEMDDMGRIVISPSAFDDFKLEKEIVFIGSQSFIKLWNVSSWNERKEIVGEKLKASKYDAELESLRF